MWYPLVTEEENVEQVNIVITFPALPEICFFLSGMPDIPVPTNLSSKAIINRRNLLATLPLQHPELLKFWSTWWNVYFDQENREHQVSYGVERKFWNGFFDRIVFIKIGVNCSSVAESKKMQLSRFQCQSSKIIINHILQKEHFIDTASSAPQTTTHQTDNDVFEQLV